MTLVLASRSPQRRALLTQLGLAFRVIDPDYDEQALALAPHELAERHSRGKALSVAAGAGETVLGVDTVVVIGGQVLGKPADATEAARMLALLAGRAHEVVSGLTLHDDLGTDTAHARTRVHFRPLDTAAIDDYVARGEWRGRAGAYAIQEAGAALVTGIDGDFFNVVGLPVALLVAMLAERRSRVSG
ncbi:MAG: nucleoside triphosphate pyrophosphatase [Gaiellales bacterium]|jgi:septum formation protein|nr:nucleoside triphosphate pyrophosphatase [Gaiellales bacterium]